MKAIIRLTVRPEGKVEADDWNTCTPSYYINRVPECDSIEQAREITLAKFRDRYPGKSIVIRESQIVEP